MVKDYKPSRGKPRARASTPAKPRRASARPPAPSRLRWFAGGLSLGVVATVVVLEGPWRFEDLKYAASDWLASQSGQPPAPRQEPDPATDRPRFEFYTLLPELEVAVPEEELIAATRPTAPVAPAARPVEAPGRYILQVGSFRRVDEAEKLKASLALLGVEAGIQSVEVGGGETWHRVRVGPFSDVERLGEARARLRENQIEAMVLKIKG